MILNWQFRIARSQSCFSTDVLVEKVFAWPGIGSYAVEALVVADYAAVQGFVLSMAIIFLILNLIIDILYTFIDPRIELGD